jgi:hypothetical protein
MENYGTWEISCFKGWPPKTTRYKYSKFGRGTREVGEAHSTARPKGHQNLWLGKGLYFRDAYMKNRTTYIDENLLVSPLSETDEKVRVFQRKLYIRAKQDDEGGADSLLKFITFTRDNLSGLSGSTLRGQANNDKIP